MVFFNYSTMQMAAKVVYYGPGLCGKTTNLQWIFDHTSNDSRGEMVSLATETDRTLFFDLLPIDVGTIAGFNTRIQLYTVPGQVFYNTTRKLVLKGVDGVVFVADSQAPMLQANIDSFANLEENLGEMGLTLETIPVVLQFNKRDLPGVLSPEELNKALNRGDWPWAEASAIKGEGVFETLKLVSKATLLALKKRLTKGRSESAGARPGGATARSPLPKPPLKPPLPPRPSSSKPAIAAPPEGSRPPLPRPPPGPPSRSTPLPRSPLPKAPPPTAGAKPSLPEEPAADAAIPDLPEAAPADLEPVEALAPEQSMTAEEAHVSSQDDVTEPALPEPEAPEPEGPEPMAPEVVAPEPIAPEVVAPEPIAPEVVTPDVVAPGSTSQELPEPLPLELPEPEQTGPELPAVSSGDDLFSAEPEPGPAEPEPGPAEPLLPEEAASPGEPATGLPAPDEAPDGFEVPSPETAATAEETAPAEPAAPVEPLTQDDLEFEFEPESDQSGFDLPEPPAVEPAEPVADLDLVTEQESAAEAPEPATAPEPVAEPAAAPEPMAEPEPVAEPEPLVTAEPSAALELEAVPGPAVPEAIATPAPVVVATPEPELVAVAEPVAAALTPSPALEATPAPVPKAPSRRRKSRVGGIDALAELEKLRRQALHPKPSKTGLPARPASASNGQEIRREVVIDLAKSDLQRASRFSLTLQLEDQDQQVLDEIHRVHVDLDSTTSLEKLLLHFNVALKAKET